MLLTDVGRSVLLGETVISGTPLVISNYSPAAVIFIVRQFTRFSTL